MNYISNSYFICNFFQNTISSFSTLFIYEIKKSEIKYTKSLLPYQNQFYADRKKFGLSYLGFSYNKLNRLINNL